MIKCFMILLFIGVTSLNAGEKIFGPKEAMEFEKVKRYDITKSGDWIYYVLEPDRGDGRLIIKSTENETEYVIDRGSYVRFSDNGNQFAINKKPKELDKINSKKDKPKNSVVLLNTGPGSEKEIQNVVEFDLSNDGKWFVYRNEKVKNEDDKKWEGGPLYLHHIESGSEILIKNASEFTIDSTSSYLFYTSHTKEGSSNGVYYRDLKKSFAPEKLVETDTAKYFMNLEWNLDKAYLSYFKSIPDSTNKADSISIQMWNSLDNSLKNIVPAYPFEGHYIPDFSKLEWNDSGDRLFFGVKSIKDKMEEEEDDDEVTEEEYFDFEKILEDTQLYTWHWNDPKIVTNSQVEWSRESKKTYLSVYHIEADKYVQLADSAVSVVSQGEQSNYLLAFDESPYLKRRTWDGWYYDLYYVDLLSGKKTLVQKEIYSTATISPDGQYIVYFDDRVWWKYNVSMDDRIIVGEKLKLTWHNKLNDRPREPNPYGFGGWFDNSDGFLLYDEYDIWIAHTKRDAIFSMTQAYGKQFKHRYRLVDVTPEKEYYGESENLYLEVFSIEEKWKKLVYFGDGGAYYEMPSDSIYNSFVKKAQYANKILLRRQSYNQYPDFYVSDTTLKEVNKITDIHPEIKDYNWGTTHMVKYKDPQGEELQGYYILPDNYDPNKKYPLFVYFYERFSDRRHLFTNPVVNHRPIYPWYIGQGYVMFFPDIKFYEGYPGKSGLDAVMAGCRALAEKGIADTNKIALHGHSWSGYQSAYFVTQTDFFAACVSGAPVSNMTSAYSGIRLGSGLARQFQYEKTQSRIGGNLVDSLDSYIRNSPVFFADKMNTPLLIMFGDIDDAVPWQQGVEMYLACRRFGKPCIFLQYENEPHHLKKFHNQLDYTFKMKEFFDHYVLGKEAEDWIKNGVPYKGTYNNGNK